MALALIAGLAILAVLLVVFYAPADKPMPEVQEPEVIKSVSQPPQPLKIVAPKVLQAPKVKPSVLSKKEEMMLKDWRQVLIFAQEQDEMCQQAIEEYLRDPNWVDLQSGLFKDKAQVLVTLNNVIAPMASRRVKGELEVLETLLESGVDFDHGVLYQEIQRLDTCRQRASLNFIDSVMEAARVFNWSIQERQQLVEFLLGQLMAGQKGDYLVFDIIFFNGLAKKLMSQGLVDHRFRDQLDFVLREALEVKAVLEDGLGHLESNQEKRKLLRQFYWTGQNLGEEMEQVLREIIYSMQR